MKKVLIVNTYLTGGGAAIAALRLAEALQKTGNVKVSILCLHGDREVEKNSNVNISCIVKNGKINLRERINFVAERLQIYLNNGFNRNKIFHISTALWGMDISNHPLVLDADIIHLHWICQGMLSLHSLDKISKMNKKVVWTLHDMWPATAVSPHLDDPNIYVSPWSEKEIRLVQKVWDKKKNIYPRLQPIFVGCSNWIKEKVAKSTLSSNLMITNIPNPIDIDRYSPDNSKKKRDCFTFIFGAVNTSDERKGFKQIIDAINILRDKGVLGRLNIKIKVFGKLDDNAKTIIDTLNMEYVGYVSSQEKMIDIYRQADCLVVPSLFENLPNTIMEAMSCGVPSVAFNVGGIKEMIENDVTGFISPMESGAKGLADNIERLATIYQMDYNRYQKMCDDCRQKVVLQYSENVVSDKYIQLYNLEH